MAYNVKATFKIKEEIKTKTYLICAANSKNEAIAKALQYATGYGCDEYKKWDDPEVLEREIISLEIIED